MKMVKNLAKNGQDFESESNEKFDSVLGKSIRYVELDNSGNVKRVLGVTKAQDFKKNTPLNPQKEEYFIRAKEYYESLCKGQESSLKLDLLETYDTNRLKDYWDEDIFIELNIRRLRI